MDSLTIGTTLHGFTVLQQEALSEIDGTAFVLLHEQSGARLLYLANEDNNKAFSIAFKTPPVDSTGVFHILEHSVLCGSEKFPVKEPFVNLIKSSMQTFLNAMTFPDKTMYPVASTNEQDLLNLMDVYLDAVLHPAIYDKRAIFEQEGWHLELDEQTNNVVYNGVVYNEMKGALSNPTSVLFNTLCAELFPDTTYRFESGGDPCVIPELTYESYLDTHKRHYCLDNSYVTIYGKVDIENMLSFLQQRYFGTAHASRSEINPLTLQAPVISTDNRITMQTSPENACMGLAYVVGTAHDRERIVATDILFDALAGSNEAPLKRALLDSGIAGNAQAFLIDSMLQPLLVIQLQDNKPDSAAAFQHIVNTTVADLCHKGIDRTKLEAALSRAEFIMAERDFDAADGVILAMQSLSGWLYDGENATDHLRYEHIFADLRNKINEGYFEALLEELILKSDHWSMAEIVPVEEKSSSEKELLEKLRTGFSKDDLEQIDEHVAELRRFQEMEDSPESLAKLPLLQLTDLVTPPDEQAATLLTDTPLPCLHHPLSTRHINYLYYYFDLTTVRFEDLPYVSILTTLLGKLDTKTYSASELDSLVQTRLGTLRFFTEVHECDTNIDVVGPKLVVGASALSHNISDLCTIPVQVWRETLFEDSSKIKDMLLQHRIAMEQGFIASGHSAAMARCSAHISKAARVREELGGIEFYLFLKDLLANFDERKTDLIARISELANHIFSPNNALSSFTGTQNEYDRFWEHFEMHGLKTSQQTSGKTLVVPSLHVRNEGFIIPTDVCYASKGFDHRLLSAPYTSSWQVAARGASFDYLWNEVRVKGGAYGAGLRVGSSGALQFYSYRDPELDETLRRFDGTAAWLASFDPSEAEMRGYLISTTAAHDAPKKPREIARRQDYAFFSKKHPDYRAHMRSEILATTPAGINAFGDVVKDAVAQDRICVFGDKTILENSKTDLELIDLFASSEK